MAKKNNVLVMEDGIQYLLIGEDKYKLPKLTLNLMRRIEDHFDIGIRQIGDLLVERSATTSLRLITFLINQTGDPITEDELGERIQYDDMPVVGEAIRKILTGK